MTATEQQAPFWLRGNGLPVEEETEAFDLEVTGAVPPARTGRFIRNATEATADLDALDLTETARVHFPVRVSHGFHGGWFADP